MKTMKTLIVAAIAVGGLALAADAAADRGSHGGGGHGSWGGSHGSWSGSHSGHWAGRGVYSGGNWGGRWGGYRGYRGPGWGFYFGVPVFASSYYWDAPYYYDYYPRDTVIYQDTPPPATIYGDEQAPTTTEVPPGANLPSQGPAYMNYCASAKAYFPKVTKCAEGWQFLPTR